MVRRPRCPPLLPPLPQQARVLRLKLRSPSQVRPASKATRLCVGVPHRCRGRFGSHARGHGALGHAGAKSCAPARGGGCRGTARKSVHMFCIKIGWRLMEIVRLWCGPSLFVQTPKSSLIPSPPPPLATRVSNDSMSAAGVVTGRIYLPQHFTSYRTCCCLAEHAPGEASAIL